MKIPRPNVHKSPTWADPKSHVSLVDMLLSPVPWDFEEPSYLAEINSPEVDQDIALKGEFRTDEEIALDEMRAERTHDHALDNLI